MIPVLEWFDLIKLKTALTMYQTYNNVLHVNLQTSILLVWNLFVDPDLYGPDM